MGSNYRPQLPSTDGSFILPDIELDRDLQSEIEFLDECGMEKVNLAMNVIYHRLEYGGDCGLDSFMEDLGNSMDSVDFGDEDMSLEKQNALFTKVADSAVLFYEEVCESLKPAIGIIEANFNNAKRSFNAYIDIDHFKDAVVVSIRGMDE